VERKSGGNKKQGWEVESLNKENDSLWNLVELEHRIEMQGYIVSATDHGCEGHSCNHLCGCVGGHCEDVCSLDCGQVCAAHCFTEY